MKITRRKFIARTGLAVAAAHLAGGARADSPPVGEPFVSPRREIRDPTTGRRLIQLTSGDCFDMPMYYFIPTTAADGKTIVFYRYHPASGEIQLYKIHCETGVTVRLTNATTANSLWRPYLQPPGHGVRELLSAVSPVTNEAVYFDGNEIRAVHLETLHDRRVARVPDDRVACGLTGISPNGRLLVYPHADRRWWDSYLERNVVPPRAEARDVQLDVVDLQTGHSRNVLYVNYWITHSNFYDNDRILICHSATDYAILLADLRNPHYFENVRARSGPGYPNHYHAAARGIMYEMVNPVMGGIYDPDARRRREYKLEISSGHLHIGRDPEARLWFFETSLHGNPVLVYFPKLSAGVANAAVPLIGGSFATFSKNQRSHFHPSLMPDRKSILFTGGDSRNETNHLFLLDVADLQDTAVQD